MLHRFNHFISKSGFTIGFLNFILTSFSVSAQSTVDFSPKTDYQILSNIYYGDDSKNNFDLYLPVNADSNTALVVFFHGGSFKNGDKKQIDRQFPVISSLLDNNIAYASVNYRFKLDDDSLGVLKCINDAVQFIQFIRHHATEYRIDKTRIGCYGESAGAGISLYLAFHDELATSTSGNLLENESTRIQCAGAIATQASYNLLRWKNYIPGLAFLYPFVKNSLKEPLANFYGYSSYKAFNLNKKEVTAKVDMLKMISPDDPPIWLYNPTTKKIRHGIPFNANQLFHHPAHARTLAKRARKENLTYFHVKNEKERSAFPIDEFFIEQLTKQ